MHHLGTGRDGSFRTAKPCTPVQFRAWPPTFASERRLPAKALAKAGRASCQELVGRPAFARAAGEGLERQSA